MAGMNSSSKATVTVALALNAQAGAPATITLLPAGVMVGADGRRFVNDDPAAVIAAFEAGGLDLPIDVEHATELKGPKGEPAPAHGWIKKLKALNGAIVAEVEWTEDGARLVTSKAYRYVSPAFLHRKDDGRVARLLSVGLTNRPNLELPALNRTTTPETRMDLAAIAAALGIATSATDADVITAINSLQSSAKAPDPTKFVPRADLDAALNRATIAEKALADQESQATAARSIALIDGGVKDGKIAPASKEHYLALCREAGGYERVEALLKTLPAITAASDLDRRPIDQPAGELTAEQKAICANTGISEEDFKKELAARAA